MVYNLQIIGEAGRAISERLKAQYRNVPWVKDDEFVFVSDETDKRL